jgi:hypothetical protein
MLTYLDLNVTSRIPTVKYYIVLQKPGTASTHGEGQPAFTSLTATSNCLSANILDFTPSAKAETGLRGAASARDAKAV